MEQIEDGELAALEAREPMPKNVQDFKDHPVYALERHLRRNEVIVADRESGKVATGNASKGEGGQKKLENVYRRKDVKICKSADAWYRLGREIKMGEQPVKVVPSRNYRKNDHADEEETEERAGTNLYTEAQTELFIPPPIVNGRVPKNSFGNIDIYVPSMIPKDGVHIVAPESVYAAKLLGIDFAAALTGFEFKGRHGTAVLRGVVVAREYGVAVQEVVKAIGEEREREREEEMRERVLGAWRRWLLGLRVWKRVGGYFEDEGDEGGMEEERGDEDAGDGKDSGGGETEAGGFVREEEDPDDGEEGGFVKEDEEMEEGGFMREDESPDEDDGEESGFEKEDEKMESDDSSELSDTYTDDDYDDDMGGGFIPE